MYFSLSLVKTPHQLLIWIMLMFFKERPFLSPQILFFTKDKAQGILPLMEIILGRLL